MTGFHRTWLSVDLDRMAKNLAEVRSHLPDGCEVCAVVKANAYGHGLTECAMALSSFGVRHFAVAAVSEAVSLRRAGVLGEILILAYVGAEEVRTLAEYSLTAAAAGYDHARALSAAAETAGVEILCHLKVNTGMNRIGFDCADDEDIERIARAYSLPAIRFTGIFSHFSSSDDISDGADEYCRLQLERFNAVLGALKARGINTGTRHMSNSGAIQKYPEAYFDMVRCGLLIMGYNTAFDAQPFAVEPVAEWKAAVTCLRKLPVGAAVSYSRRFVAERETIAATLAVGYADGWPRALSNRGYVLINGRRAPMIGSVCMDQMMVDVTDISDVKVGDTAVLIGRSQNAVQTGDDVAEAALTCTHEIVSRIGERVEREYLNGTR